MRQQCRAVSLLTTWSTRVATGGETVAQPGRATLTQAASVSRVGRDLQARAGRMRQCSWTPKSVLPLRRSGSSSLPPVTSAITQR